MTTMQARCLFLAMLATGCGAALSPAMHAYPGPEAQGAPPDRARVVFVRPSSGAFHSIFTLIDEHGYFLGDSSAGCRFSVFMAPGDHHVVALTDEAASLRMTLAPGRTYYVEVRPHLGVWEPQVQLVAVNRQSGLLKSIHQYLARTRVTIPDFAAGQAHLYGLGSQAPEAAQRGVRAHAGYSPDAKAAATLQPEDGQ